MLYAEVILANAKDLLYAEDGNLPKQKIRQIATQMLVDSSPIMLITQAIQQRLGLREKRKQKGKLPNGTVAEMSIVGPIEVYFGNQSCTVDAFVLPTESEQALGTSVLGTSVLGTISMEYMNLVVLKGELKAKNS